ncbi:response regulator transcription factor [Pseudoxanthomonas sp. LjRoot143]|uniref:response regulator transcription factor n=1 Tax=Pseudoxanthomonas sp. LjRoot143 TaxID=3342266 RepID=UPI003ECC46C4
MSNSGIILLVEDNRILAEAVGSYLETRGLDVDYAVDGMEGYRLAQENRYDAIVLDGNMPRMDGLEVVRKLREESRMSTPIIMVTARDTLEDKIRGLELGVDDYLTKPFAAQELEARLRAVIRRNRKQLCGQALRVGDLTYDPASQRATRAGKELHLSRVATQLLQILMRESPRVVTRREIEREIWGDDLPDSDVLRSHLYNLRKGIDKDFSSPLLQTVQSAGYRLADLSHSQSQDTTDQPPLASAVG